MTPDEADDIVDDWHEGLYPGLELREVFIQKNGWTDEEFELWARTGKTPE